MPPSTRNNTEMGAIDVFELHLLFETDDENDEFFGFNVSVENENATFSEIRQILDASSSDEDFLGFSNAHSNSELNLSFFNDSDNNDFFGF